METDIQATIDFIRSASADETELLRLLQDARALVRAIVLLELTKRRSESAERVAGVVANAAHAPIHADVRLMGTITQRILAVATLAWLRTDEAGSVFEQEFEKLSEDEQRRVRALVAKGPIS